MATTSSCIHRLLDLPPRFIQQVAAGTIAILVVWHLFGDYARRAAALHVIGLRVCGTGFGSELIDSTYLTAAALDQCEVPRQRPIEITRHPGLVGFGPCETQRNLRGKCMPCDAKLILRIRVKNDYGRHVRSADYS